MTGVRDRCSWTVLVTGVRGRRNFPSLPAGFAVAGHVRLEERTATLTVAFNAAGSRGFGAFIGGQGQRLWLSTSRSSLVTPSGWGGRTSTWTSSARTRYRSDH